MNKITHISVRDNNRKSDFIDKPILRPVCTIRTSVITHGSKGELALIIGPYYWPGFLI